MMKLGILYPRSNAYPGIMMDFMDGLKTSLAHLKLDDRIRLISENTGLGGNEKEVYEQAEKLLVLEGVDMLVAFIDLRVLETLKPLLFASGKLVLVVNPGANYPQNWVPQGNIINLTLQHGFLCWLTSQLASQLPAKKAAMATTFYDSGYLHVAAMVKGFEKVAGTITYNYVNNQRCDHSFDIKPLTDHLTSDKETTGLLCIFDTLPASLFYEQLNNYKEAGNLHLFVSPMMLEKKAMEKIGGGYKFTVDGYLPWYASSGDRANKVFRDSYKLLTKREANVFSLLGWETGLILKEVYEHGIEQYADGSALAGKLAAITISSPRGEMKLDAQTNYFLAPSYRCSVKHNSGTPVYESTGSMEKEWNDFAEVPTEGVSSGWTNTYLCY